MTATTTSTAVPHVNGTLPDLNINELLNAGGFNDEQPGQPEQPKPDKKIDSLVELKRKNYEMMHKFDDVDEGPDAIESAIGGIEIADDDGEDEQPSLDVPVVGNLSLGWIDNYSDLMESLTGSPKEFHQLAGLLTVASALQRRAWLPMSFGDIYPNVYGCIIAPSTVFGKSTSINGPRRVLLPAMMEKMLIPAQGSSEGLIKQLSLTPSALMIRDEIGTLFGSDRVKYLKDYKQDLTALYDCMPHSKRLSNEEIKVERPYLNILGATTPSRFYGNVTNDDWLDGFMPRWLFVQPEGEPNFDNATGMFNHEGAISKLAWKLMEIDRQKETAFTLQGESFKMWSSWRTESLKLAWKQQDETAMAIIGRYATYALKFATILTAINGDWGTVTESTMQTAIDMAGNYKHNVNRILSERGKHEVSGGKLQKAFLLLQRKGGADGLTARQMSISLNMGKSQFTPIIDKLVEIGAVMTTERNNAKNRAVTYYHAVAEKLPVGRF